MNSNLTGQKVSLTYGQLIQKIDASYYTGLGEPIFFLDVSTLENSLSNVDASLNAIRSEYIPDASLSNNFIWASGKLYVDVSSAASNVNPNFDYQTYSPRTSDVSFYYTGDSVSKIITTNDIGVKTVDFIYDLNGDVSVINIDNYGLNTKVVSFEKDINGNILAVHID